MQEHGANAAPIAKSVSGMQAEISAVTAQVATPLFFSKLLRTY